MKKIIFFAMFMATSVLVFSQIVLEKNTKTGEIRTRPEADSVVWEEMGIEMSSEATQYMSGVQKAIENPGDTISVSRKYRQFMGMKDFFYVQFCNVYFTGIMFNETEKSISVVKEYRTETQTVFAWQNVFVIISVFGFFFLKKLMKKENKIDSTISVFAITFISTLLSTILCMAVNIVYVSPVLFFSGVVACVATYLYFLGVNNKDKITSFLLRIIFYICMSIILLVPFLYKI